MALTRQEISARHYRIRKENGLCPRCGEKTEPGRHLCKSCREKVNEYNRETRDFCRKNGICTVCHKEKVFGEERICPECLVKNEMWRKPLSEEQKDRYEKSFRKQQNSLYQERKASGICTRCGKRKAMPGKAKCGICLEKDAEMHRKQRFDRPNIREERIKNQLCLWCGNPATENKKTMRFMLAKVFGERQEVRRRE